MPGMNCGFWTSPPIDENFQQDNTGELKRPVEAYQQYVNEVKNVAKKCGVPVFDLHGACLRQVGFIGEGTSPGKLGVESQLSSIAHDGIMESQRSQSPMSTLVGGHPHYYNDLVTPFTFMFRLLAARPWWK
jgi:hypothetical protein